MKYRKVILTNAEGFTLLEILVVLTVIGFLIAMVSPRLAGISDTASGTVCDTNKGRAKTYMSAFYEKYDRYPNHVTNLVMTDGTDLPAANVSDTGYQIPYCSDDDPYNGPEVMNAGHNNMYKFMIHRLSQEEAGELISLGISEVYNLNDYAADADGLNGAAATGRTSSATSDGDRVSNWGDITAVADQRPSMESCPVTTGVGVAMCGCGVNAVSGNAFRIVQVERAWAEEDIFARMVFGLGPESELVTSGLVTNAAHCPGSIQNAENFTWGGYYLIVPRLEATADRLAATDATFTSLWGSSVSYASLSADDTQALSWPKGGTTPSLNYDIDANDEHFKVRTGLKLTEAMEPWDYDTNRQRYDEIWGIDLGGNSMLLGGS